MINSKLVILEGMPGTGKSTNSGFLFRKLKSNGMKPKWIPEVINPHPTSYFDEASMTYSEYELFSARFLEAGSILDKLIIRRKNTVGFDLLEIEKSFRDSIGKNVLEELKQHDVWTFSLDEYEEAALDKWSCFVEASIKEPGKIIILESSVFQFQIFTYLLKDAAYKKIEEFIDKLFQILAPLNPVLIYLYRERNEDSVAYLEKDRGVQFLEYIWNRDKGEPYYKDRPEGAEGYRQFLLDYGKWADNLFKAASCRKLSIDISGREWAKYEQEMLSFLDIENMPESDEKLYTGIFMAEASDNELKIDRLTLTDPKGQVRKLTPKSENEFYIQYLPLVLKFDGPDKVIIEGDQMPESWAASGTVYVRQ